VAPPVIVAAAVPAPAPASDAPSRGRKKKASVLTSATTPAPELERAPSEPVVTSPFKTPAAAPIAAPVNELPVMTSKRQTSLPAPPPVDSPAAVAVTKPVEKPVVKQEEKQPLSDMDNAILNKMEHLQFYYDFNSAILTTASREMLDRVAVVLSQYPTWKLMVRSYTDARGSDAYNKDLSALRCYAVIDYLIKKGIASNKLYYENIGKDPEDPCGKGVPCTERQYQAARRTTLKITPQ